MTAGREQDARETLDLPAVAAACESFLDVWRDHFYAAPSEYGPPVLALRAALLPSPPATDGQARPTISGSAPPPDPLISA